MKLSIIVPVFNEEKTVYQILEKLNSLKLEKADKEMVVVDDGSTDGTASKIKNFVSKNKGIKFYQLKKNSGKGSAVRLGISKATGEFIIIQDADLEYDPQYIKKLLVPILENKTEVVYGTRLARLPHLKGEESSPRFLLHYFGNRVLSLIASILYGQWITDMETCYKLFPRKAAQGMTLRSRRFDFEPEITSKLMKKGYKIMEIPIITKPRGYEEGKKLRTFKDGSIALLTLLKYRLLD